MTFRHAIAVLAFAIARAAAAQVQAPSNAADEYDRIARVLNEIDPEQDGPWSDSDGASYSAFMQRGEIDARMQRWLDATRPLIAELERATSLPYDRPLDHSQGFTLLLPHLSRQRLIARSLDLLMVDAQYRDPAQCVGILRAQAAIGERAASDGLLISSLVSMACGQMSRARLADMIDHGAIDAELAKGALSATESIAGIKSLNLGRAVDTENEMLALEIGRLRDATGDDHSRRVAELTALVGRSGADPAMFSDDALAGFPAQAEAYQAAARAVVDAPNREAAAKAEAALEQAVEAGTYGALLKTLAPALSTAIDRAWRYDADWAAVRGDLQSLADGSKTPEDLMDAGIHYLRAASAAQQLRVPEQAEFDSLRLAGSNLEADIRAIGKSRLARVQQSITAEVYRGSQLGRLRLDERTLGVREALASTGLVRATQPGINGAVRTMLAAAITDDAVTKAPLDKPVAAPQELAVAAVRVAAHYASTGQFGHSLAALAMLRDAADALDVLKAQGQFDASGRALLAKALARITADDPVGLTRAVTAERAQARTAFADADRIARLSPGELAFLVAAIAAPDAALASADCNCPDHGALLDMRAWFDADALAKLKPAHDHIEALHERAREKGLKAIAGAPLEGLEVAPPFDVERARESARIAVERLQRLAE